MGTMTGQLVHLSILFGLGKMLKLDLAELAMASAVGIGGPWSAASLASAKGFCANWGVHAGLIVLNTVFLKVLSIMRIAKK